MRFLDPETLVEWVAQRATAYPVAVAIDVEFEELGVVVTLEDGSEVHTGLFGEYPDDVDLRASAAHLFNDLTVAIALKRMKRNREELVKSGKD